MSKTLILTCACAASLALVASAHHIMGIPHYAYDESYPQAPVITYAVEAGPYMVRVTGYPGRPGPNSLAEVHAYITRASDANDVFHGPIEARLERDGLLGPEVVWGPSETRFEDNLHKLAPQFGEAGNYRLRLEMMLEGQPYEIDFPMVAGDPSSPLGTLILWGAGLVFAIVLARAARIKLDRRRHAQGLSPAGAS